jgi:hypothetical protein
MGSPVTRAEVIAARPFYGLRQAQEENFPSGPLSDAIRIFCRPEPVEGLILSLSKRARP